MKRNHWLALGALLLLLGNVAWNLWTNWGLITLKSENRPLGEVIRLIEKQGGVTLKTDLDPATPVRMNVEKVTLAEALETLSTLLEARWRLAYLVAADKGAISNALSTFIAGQRVEGWKMLSVQAPTFGDEPAVLPDPRRDPWEVRPATEAKLHAYLQQASRSVAASFIYPEGWNPDIGAPPKSGPIAKSLPRLAKAASAQFEEVFLLQKRDRGEGGPGEDGGDGPRFASFDGGRDRKGFSRDRGGDREGMEERIQAEINKLPEAERAAARKEHDERKRFFEEMRDLKPEERMAKMEEFMSNPANEEKMDKGMAARDSRRSPEQRAERAQKYRDRKRQAMNSQK